MTDREKALEALESIKNDKHFHSQYTSNGYDGFAAVQKVFTSDHDADERYIAMRAYLSKPSFEDAVKIVEDLPTGYNPTIVMVLSALRGAK